LQALGSHLEPFFRAIFDTVEGNDAAAVALTLLFRVLLITAYVLAVYALARVINVLIGGSREIVIEEEVIVEVEEEDDEEDEPPAPKDTTKKVKRGKKDR